jgi:hypothetical protein
MAAGRASRSILDHFADQPVAAGCRKPSPHSGRHCLRLGGASSGFIADNKDLSREPGMPMETMLSELVLVALLLAVVGVSGKV